MITSASSFSGNFIYESTSKLAACGVTVGLTLTPKGLC